VNHYQRVVLKLVSVVPRPNDVVATTYEVVDASPGGPLDIGEQLHNLTTLKRLDPPQVQAAKEPSE
jgi:hypothetical protein